MNDYDDSDFTFTSFSVSEPNTNGEYKIYFNILQFEKKKKEKNKFIEQKLSTEWK